MCSKITPVTERTLAKNPTTLKRPQSGFHLLAKVTPDPEGALTARNGKLYGATPSGGTGSGNVFELTENSGVWTYQSLYNFTAGNDGWQPVGNVLVDANGNVYGTAGYAGKFNDGVIYELTP